MQQSVMKDQEQIIGCSCERKSVQASAHSLLKAVYQRYSVVYIIHLSYFAKVFSMAAVQQLQDWLQCMLPYQQLYIHHSCSRGCP